MFSSSVTLSRYGLTQLTLCPQQVCWYCAPAFPIAPRPSMGICSQKNFFRMTHTVILERACQKELYLAIAKTSCSTHTVTVLRWPQVQPAVFQQVKPVAGNFIGDCSLYKFLPQDTLQRVLILIPAISRATERLQPHKGDSTRSWKHETW